MKQARAELGKIRLTGGEACGARLYSPPGFTTRPALARVRQSLFNILGDVSGATILDLFAGTGALAFESLSRGAKKAWLFESDETCLEAIRQSAEKLRMADRLEVVPGDLFSSIRKAAGADADVAFVDPPYAMIDEEAARPRFARLLADLRPSLRQAATVIIEHRDRAQVPEVEGFEITDRREYGQTVLTFLRT